MSITLISASGTRHISHDESNPTMRHVDLWKVYDEDGDWPCPTFEEDQANYIGDLADTGVLSPYIVCDQQMPEVSGFYFLSTENEIFEDLDGKEHGPAPGFSLTYYNAERKHFVNIDIIRRKCEYKPGEWVWCGRLTDGVVGPVFVRT